MNAQIETQLNGDALALLREFFNNHHDKLLCTASGEGEPNIAIMGTPRLAENGHVEFELSAPASVTFQNIKENKAVLFLAYVPGKRARDYSGVRIYAEVLEIQTAGPKLASIRNRISERHGAEKAAELLATITCRIKQVRPVVDRGQSWNEVPFAEE